MSVEIKKLSGVVDGYQYILVDTSSTIGHKYKLTDPHGNSVFATCTTEAEARQLTSNPKAFWETFCTQ